MVACIVDEHLAISASRSHHTRIFPTSHIYTRRIHFGGNLAWPRIPLKQFVLSRYIGTRLFQFLARLYMWSKWWQITSSVQVNLRHRCTIFMNKASRCFIRKHPPSGRKYLLTVQNEDWGMIYGYTKKFKCASVCFLNTFLYKNPDAYYTKIFQSLESCTNEVSLYIYRSFTSRI